MFGYVEKVKVIAFLDKEIEGLKIKYNSSIEKLIRYVHGGLSQTLVYKFEHKKCDEYMAQLTEVYKLRKFIEEEVV